MNTYQKIKKYLFILALFFCVFIWAHFIFMYLYEDAQTFPEKWWTISVWFIWNPSSLNPFEFWLDKTNDYILQFLYRSLLRYDTEKNTMTWDIATCNLENWLDNIKCLLKTNQIWNDWTLITKNDILKTYSFLKTSDINKPIKKLLENIEILDKWEYIQFVSKNSDLLILDLFLMPIIKASQIEQIEKNSWNFNINFINSWPYNFVKKEFDSKYDVQKITITLNENLELKDIYILKYIFKFFNDKNSLLKNENTLNIIYPQEWQNFIVSPRYDIYNFNLNQYIWLFLNKDTLSNLELRKSILFHLWNINLKDLDTSFGKVIKNPFLTDTDIVPELNSINLTSIINKLWFYKKDYFFENINKKYNDLLKPKVWVFKIPNSSYFTLPSNKSIYFHSWSSEIMISWNVPDWINKVFINDYQLKSFVPWNKKFYFKANLTFKTLKIWKNVYNLYFEVNWKKVKKDVFTIYYYTNSEELKKKKEEINNQFLKNKPLSANDIKKINTDKEKEIKIIEKLDNAYFYDKNYNKFSLTLEYVNEWKFFDHITQKIQDELKFIWINVIIKEINQKWIEDIITKWIKNYDLLLTWINNWLISYNIATFFHSWQAKIWFNLSKIKNIQLDLLLENLKSKLLDENKLNIIKNDVLKIIKNEAILKTFHSPYISFYIDKNLKNIKTFNTLPYKYYTYDIIKNSYIKEQKIINFNNKNLNWFFIWCNNKLLDL